MKYRKELDAIRGIAIVLVVLFHYNYIIGFGWIGVQLFFVLSGYLITSILLGSKEHGGKVYFKRFYWRRTLRIFPVYYLYIIIISLLYLFVRIPINFDSISLFLYTYTYNFEPLVNGFKIDFVFTHFWSLSVEEQFYLVWPLVVFLLNRHHLKYVVVAIIVLSPLVRYITFELLLKYEHVQIEYIGQLIYRMTFCQFDSFAFGAAISLFNLKSLNLDRYFWLILGLVVVLSVGLSLYIGNDLIQTISTLGFYNGGLQYYQYIWSYTFISLLSVLLIIKFENAGNSETSATLRFVATNPLLVFIGKISYGIYIYHWPLMSLHRKFVMPFLGNNIFTFILFFGFCILVSFLSFKYFESYFLGFKDKKFK